MKTYVMIEESEYLIMKEKVENYEREISMMSCAMGITGSQVKDLLSCLKDAPKECIDLGNGQMRMSRACIEERFVSILNTMLKCRERGKETLRFYSNL